MNSIVIIEDDRSHREMVETLLAAHFTLKVYSYASAEEFFSSDIKHSNCIYLIDWNLPGIQGPKIVKIIRSKDELSPIFIISGYLSPQYVVEGVEAGADAYISKPYPQALLVNHIIRAQKRFDAIKAQLLNVGIKLFENSGMVIRNGTQTILTPREFRVFKVLYSNIERVWKREELLPESTEADPSGRSIDVTISSLRKSLFELGLEIETVRGEGYQLKVK